MALVESFSGIRGIYDKDLTDAIAVRYAYSYYSFLKSKTKKSSITIVIGMDTRASGIKLADSIMGILDCNFIDIGIAPTPAVEFAVRHFNADGGIIITASHNEPYWNGFKFLDNDGAILRPKDINKVIGFYNKIKNLKEKDFLKKYLYNEKNKNDIKLKKIIKKYIEVNEIYSDFILNFLTKEDIQNIKNSKLKIIIDPNGGTAI